VSGMADPGAFSFRQKREKARKKEKLIEKKRSKRKDYQKK
jgi:hypothetical protein